MLTVKFKPFYVPSALKYTNMFLKYLDKAIISQNYTFFLYYCFPKYKTEDSKLSFMIQTEEDEEEVENWVYLHLKNPKNYQLSVMKILKIKNQLRKFHS